MEANVEHTLKAASQKHKSKLDDRDICDDTLKAASQKSLCHINKSYIKDTLQAAMQRHRNHCVTQIKVNQEKYVTIH